MESFTNNPTEWSIEGNLIGSILGNLTNYNGFIKSHAQVVAGTTREIENQTINFIRINYVA